MEKYKLMEYTKCLQEERQILEDCSIQILKDESILKIAYNSNEVTAKTLFVCKGLKFKEEYLKQAVNNGAIAYISEKKYEVEIPCILVKNVQIALSIVSAKYFSYPAKKLNIIGITGTKGKSTTTYYIKYILDEYAKRENKKNTGIISSIDTYDGILNFESHITTPESLDLQNNFNNAVTSGIKNIVMEVSSQALKYGRVHNVDFNYGLFLNISEDHISPIEHPDFEDYFNSKLKIFSHTNIACVNLDTDAKDMVEEIAKRDSKRVITFSTKDKSADVYGYNIRKEGFNTVFSVKTCKFDKEFMLTMPGLFNVENALGAICIAIEMEIPEDVIYEGLKKAKSSGRMEVHYSNDKKIIAIVDYAHNKLSFEKLYESTKNEYPDRRIITVFGSAGRKAFLRRRDLGLLAGKNSDKVYLTAEDPGTEPVEDISKDIAQYVKIYNDNFEMIADRGEAINAAINTAINEYDKTVILVTGKGNETRQKIGNEYIPCKTDIEYVKMFLKEYDETIKQNKTKQNKIK
ncbi:MAG: UDP-N-acetylmuramyl-tripeptide synthetase [Clostridia bacterium]